MDRQLIVRDLEQLAVAGLAATAIMTALAYAAPLMGMPESDFAQGLGARLTGKDAPKGTGPWWVGMAEHFLNGSVIFPFIYGFALREFLAGRRWHRGIEWGIILWLLSQSAVSPMMGMGVFSTKTPQPAKTVLGNFVGHLVYGAVLGAMGGRGRSRS
jgi:hypothetical protein